MGGAVEGLDSKSLAPPQMEGQRWHLQTRLRPTALTLPAALYPHPDRMAGTQFTRR